MGVAANEGSQHRRMPSLRRMACAYQWLELSFFLPASRKGDLGFPMMIRCVLTEARMAQKNAMPKAERGNAHWFLIVLAVMVVFWLVILGVSAWWPYHRASEARRAFSEVFDSCTVSDSDSQFQSSTLSELSSIRSALEEFSVELPQHPKVLLPHRRSADIVKVLGEPAKTNEDAVVYEKPARSLTWTIERQELTLWILVGTARPGGPVQAADKDIINRGEVVYLERKFGSLASGPAMEEAVGLTPGAYRLGTVH